MCSNGIKQHQNRLGDRAAIAFHVQSSQQNKRVGNFLDSRIELASIDWMHWMESAYLQFTVGAEGLPVCE
jgi:hypothetical protein